MVNRGSISLVLVVFLAITLVSSSYTAFSVPVFAIGPGSFIDAFVIAGSGGLNNPDGLTFGPDGNFYVSSGSSNEVLRYDGTTGIFIDSFVSSGSGGLDVPRNLVFGPDGNLYVTSGSSNEVLRYDGTTGIFIDAFVSSGSGGLDTPKGLVFGPDGNLYVSSNQSHEVKRYDGSTGVFIDTFVSAGSGGLDEPHVLLFGSDGNLYVTSFYTDSVLRYDGTTGIFIDSFVSSGSGGLIHPDGMSFAPDGNLYVISNQSDEVKRYDGSTGVFIDTFVSAGSGGINDPDSLTFAPDGNLYVTNGGTTEVLRYQGPLILDIAPSISITAPSSGSNYVNGTTVHFIGTANDPEDGPLHSSISWSSDLDGALGIGGPPFPISSLSIGTHTITASVTDSGSNTVSDSITIIISTTPLIVLNPDDVAEEKALLEKIKKQREETRNKNDLKEKRLALKEIKNGLSFKNLLNDEEKLKIQTFVNEIKEIIIKLNENPEYDKEFKRILKQEMKEKKFKIKNEMTNEKLSKNKVDSKIYSLSKSDNPKIDAKKLGLQFKNGKTKIVIKLYETNSKVFDKLGSIGKIDAKNGKHVQLTIKLSDIPKLRSINGIDGIRAPFSAVQYDIWP